MENSIVKGFGKCPKLPWMIEFHSTADGKIFNNQLKAAFADNYLEHLSSLNERSKGARKRLTQLLAVIPPHPSNELLEKLIMAGMTTAQFRMAYFTPEDLQNTINRLRTVNEEFGKKIGRIYPLAFALDIADPEIVTGKLSKSSREHAELEKGKTTKVTTNKEFSDRTSKDYIYVNYESLPEVVKPGDSLILGNQINLSALSVARDIINCLVERAGVLTDNLCVNLPNIPVTLLSTESQNEFLKIGAEKGVDTVFVSPNVLKSARQILGQSITIIMKIENATALEQFERNIDGIDGVLIDAEKLMVTLNEKVFLAQKSIVAKCNKKGIPVMGVITCNSIGKAQVFDIANSVIDGLDGLLLPPDPDIIETTSSICKSAEGAIYQKQLFDNLSNLQPPPIEPIYSLSIAAVEASFKSHASAIILITTSGRSAKLISRYRPRCPIIALTRFGRIAKQLMLYKGVIPIFYVKSKEGEYDESLKDNMQLGMTFGKLNGYIRMGDAVVIVFGLRHGVGFKNCLEVVYASEYDTIPLEDS